MKFLFWRRNQLGSMEVYEAGGDIDVVYLALVPVIMYAPNPWFTFLPSIRFYASVLAVLVVVNELFRSSPTERKILEILLMGRVGRASFWPVGFPLIAGRIIAEYRRGKAISDRMIYGCARGALFWITWVYCYDRLFPQIIVFGNFMAFFVLLYLTVLLHRLTFWICS